MIKINYGINRKGKGGRLERDSGSIELPDVPANLFELDRDQFDIYHMRITRLIKERHPGWLITGYAPASEDSGWVFEPGGALALNPEGTGEQCPHGVSKEVRCEQCVNEGVYTHALPINLSDSGQMFAGVATIRAAIFDVIDGGMHGDATEPWEFHLDLLASDQDALRAAFADDVLNRIGELQLPPHDGIKLENLCPRHRREVLPKPTAKVCGMCEVERHRRTCVFKDGICECGRPEY